MQMKAIITLIGKKVTKWNDKDGVEHLSYIANISQNNGCDVSTIRLNEEQFNRIESNKVYTITCEYNTSKNGNYLRIIDIVESK